MNRFTAAAEIAENVRSGTSTASAETAAALARAKDAGLRHNSVTVLRTKQSQAEAAELDNTGDPQALGALAGVPVAVKEEYDVAGDVTTLGGRGNSVPASHDAAVIAKLRDAGAVIVARTNMPEFGQFPCGESDYHGATLNPHNTAFSPGGSSAGSAALVAAGAVPIALGADGGGSLRIPAAACGVFGLKPTRGLVSSAPLTQHWFGLATFGAITRTALDMALVLDVMRGNEPGDVWRLPGRVASSKFVKRTFAEIAEAGAQGILPHIDGRAPRLRVVRNPILPTARVDREVRQALGAFVKRLKSNAYAVRETRVRWPQPTIPFLILHLAGMAEEATQVDNPHLLTERTLKTARLGKLIPKFVVRWAVRRAERVAERLDAAFKGADLLVLPTMTSLPVSAHAYAQRGWLSSLLLAAKGIGNAALFNVSGHPAMSVHAGFSRDGVPIGVQFVARRGHDDLLLAVAAHLEANGGIVAKLSA